MSNSRVQDHYAKSGAGHSIAERILTAVYAAGGPAAPVTPEKLAPFDHYHSGGLAATEGLAKLLEPQAGESIVDIGSGIGGPARWLANRFNCKVTGVDLTPEFCDAARQLNTHTEMVDRVVIHEGSALALPLPNGGFDRAYSQYVVMNIADKLGVYREAARVLKPDGRLVLCHVGAGANGQPDYPLPWAGGPEHSFLASDEETRRDLGHAGLQIISFRDTTQPLQSLVTMRQKLESEGMPAVGVPTCWLASTICKCSSMPCERPNGGKFETWKSLHSRDGSRGNQTLLTSEYRHPTTPSAKVRAGQGACTSGSGTFETRRPVVAKAAFKGRPEVAGGRLIRRD